MKLLCTASMPSAQGYKYLDPFVAEIRSLIEGNKPEWDWDEKEQAQADCPGGAFDLGSVTALSDTLVPVGESAKTFRFPAG